MWFQTCGFFECRHYAQQAVQKKQMDGTGGWLSATQGPWVMVHCTACTECWKCRWLADELAQPLLCVKGPKQGSVCLCTCTFGRRHCPDLQCRALSLFHCFQGDIAHSIVQDCRGMVYFHMPVLPLAEVYTRAHGAGQGVWKISVVILCCAGRSVC